jgi:hypothetical protein
VDKIKLKQVFHFHDVTSDLHCFKIAKKISGCRAFIFSDIFLKAGLKAA